MQSIDIFITLWFMFVDPTAMITTVAWYIQPIRIIHLVCAFPRLALFVYSSQATTKLYDHRHYYYYREKFLNHHKNILIIQPRGSVCCGAVAIAAPIQPCMVWFQMPSKLRTSSQKRQKFDARTGMCIADNEETFNSKTFTFQTPITGRLQRQMQVD
jgi:hypothetical protein